MVVTRGGGLRIGTSFNSLGLNKASEISVLSVAEANMREVEVDAYLTRQKREHNNVRLNYSLFTL